MEEISITKKSGRLLGIDFLRGLAILIMTIDHVRDSFHSFPLGDLINNDADNFLFFTRFITHFCAPAFIFLAGISAFLHLQKNNFNFNQIQLFLVKRGIFLIIIEFTLISFLWKVIFDLSFYSIDAQVLWAIGVSMIFLAFMLYFATPIILLVSILLLTTHNLLDKFNITDSLLWNLLHVKTQMPIGENLFLSSYYPLLPWLGLMSLGYCFGYYLWNKNFPSEKRKTILLRLSLILIALLLLLRGFSIYGDSNKFIDTGNFITSLRSFLNVTKYPPSLHYILITLPFTLAILAVSEKWNNKLVRIISNYGTVAMFYYIVHLVTIPTLNFVLSLIFKEDKFVSVDLSLTYLIWITIIILLYPVILWFKNIKMKFSDKFPLLSYF